MNLFYLNYFKSMRLLQCGQLHVDLMPLGSLRICAKPNKKSDDVSAVGAPRNLRFTDRSSKSNHTSITSLSNRRNVTTTRNNVMGVTRDNYFKK